MRYGSLFTGIGGFDLGFTRAGMECAWQVEIDKNCLKLLEQRFPDARRYHDIRECGKHNLEPVDVITGGFPCQDLSVAGKRAGLAGGRSGLWFEFARVIDELEPGWVIVENVPGLLSSNGGKDFAVIIRWLAERGYGVAWRVLDAQYFGVAQRRRRVFIVGSLGDGRAAEVLFEHRTTFNDTSITTRLDAQCNIKEFSDDNNGKRGETSALQFRGNERYLMPIECERLQGFPDGWTEGFANSTRYRMLGNAVAVPVVEWIGQRVAERFHPPAQAGG